MPPALRYSVDSGIARIRFVRPDQLNSIDDQALEELAEVMKDVAADRSLRALCLTGTGRAFCVGLDLDLLKRAFFDLAYWEDVLYKLNDIYLAMGGTADAGGQRGERARQGRRLRVHPGQRSRADRRRSQNR